MPTWKVTKFIPYSHTITLKHEDGETLTVTIPAEHQISHETKNAYIKIQTDARDVAKNIKKVETKAKKLINSTTVMAAIVLAESVALVMIIRYIMRNV